MPGQVNKTVPSTEKTQDTTSTPIVSVENVETQSANDKLKQELDDLLDEIDGVLETNAEEFVSNYIQKGGQAVWVKLKILGGVPSVGSKSLRRLNEALIFPGVGVLPRLSTFIKVRIGSTLKSGSYVDSAGLRLS
jgi:ubiquitin-like protein Pup